MISGESPDTPVDTIRASGVSPSSRARTSLITTTPEAPSFSGQQLPAVTVPSSRNTGFSPDTPSVCISTNSMVCFSPVRTSTKI